MMSSVTASLAPMLGRAFSGAAREPEHPTRERILDAVVAELAMMPLRKLALEDVARRAGVSRMTMYRHFGERDQLIEATIARETSRILQAVMEADDRGGSAADRIAQSFVTGLRETRAHPMIDRWLAADPGGILDLVLAEDSQVLRTGTAFIADAAQAISNPTDHGKTDPQRVAELLIRLFVALLLMPPPTIDLNDPDQARRLARDLITPIVVGAN